jgi:hypothetical protein
MSLYGAVDIEGAGESALATVGKLFGQQDELSFGRTAFVVLSCLLAIVAIAWFAGYICKSGPKEGLDIKLARMAQTPDAANMGDGANAPAALGPIPSGRAIAGSVDCSQPQVGDDAWMWQRANMGRAGEPFVITPEDQMNYYKGYEIVN